MVTEYVLHSRKVLALDTSSSKLSLAISTDAELLASVVDASGLPHSQQLYPFIQNSLRDLQLSVSDIDVFAVNTGPGSFTGLRVGLAASLGLAFTLGKPLWGISALDALAYEVGLIAMPIAIILDAARGEYFVGFRQLQSELSIRVIGEDQVISRAQIPQALNATLGDVETVFIGAGASVLWHELAGNRQWILAETPAFLTSTIAKWVAKQSLVISPSNVEAYYLRPCDAEIKKAI